MKTILIVDDQADIRRVLASTLQGGYKVAESIDGYSALLAVQHHKPDAVLLDIMLPGIDGFKVLREIRCDPANADMPVAMLSALGQPGDIEQADKLGADAYFVKPFSPRQILDWLEQTLGPDPAP